MKESSRDPSIVTWGAVCRVREYLLHVFLKFELAAGTVVSDLHVGVNAQKNAGEENVGVFPKIEERTAAVPSGSTTDAEVVERFFSS